ncbi:hypothetical protein N7462_009973 [Penicillium macrosclerotiorum]|uniref:uncharacterized protein n=1 Tax=Penicillium macrosclerotiorum TaxID=303699 RepID=UPI002549ABA9|nr:uncharacterized protein N7462_009973 [Penicillium macrosclerotiorum]KAJ5668903.1 hypothetical protein N7462_009973 [Penicillium macrosclerotiorum]
MEETGPICLGHFIADIEHIDFALNQGCIEEFPPSMRVYQTKTIHFKWDENTEASGGGSFGMGAPAPGGMAIKGSLKQVFRRSVHSYEEYDRLDTYIVQPNKAYIAECLEIDELASHIAGKRSWSAFMITGLKVARKGFKTLHQARGTKNELGSEM